MVEPVNAIIPLVFGDATLRLVDAVLLPTYRRLPKMRSR